MHRTSATCGVLLFILDFDAIFKIDNFRLHIYAGIYIYIYKEKCVYMYIYIYIYICNRSGHTTCITSSFEMNDEMMAICLIAPVN